MTEKNYAITFSGLNVVELLEVPRREPLPNEIVIRTECSLISTGTELTCLHRRFAAGGHFDQWVKYPFFPGYSNVGSVVRIGAEVRRFKVGDRVASRTAHQQFVTAAEDAVVTIPAEVTNPEAVWFGLGTIVQNGIRRAQHALGDNVVVIGLGPLGQLAVQYARLSGAREVVAIDTVRRRLEMAHLHGATAVISLSVEAAKDCVLEATHGQLADVVYDITGHPAVLAPALSLARTLGKVVLLGDAGDPTQQHLSGDLITRGITLIGAHDNNPPTVASPHAFWTRKHMAELFLSYVARKQLEVAALITHRFSPAEAKAAYRCLSEERATAMGVIFNW